MSIRQEKTPLENILNPFPVFTVCLPGDQWTGEAAYQFDLCYRKIGGIQEFSAPNILLKFIPSHPKVPGTLLSPENIKKKKKLAAPQVCLLLQHQ